MGVVVFDFYHLKVLGVVNVSAMGRVEVFHAVGLLSTTVVPTASQQCEDVLHGAWASQNISRAAAASDPCP